MTLGGVSTIELATGFLDYAPIEFEVISEVEPGIVPGGH